jgi:hypothetical protein
LDVGHQLACTITVTYPLLGVTDSATSAPVTLTSSAPIVLPLPAPVGAAPSPSQPGPPGPPGKIELVKCTTHTKTVKRAHSRVKVQTCTTRLVSKPVKFTTGPAGAHATLSRGRSVYATGSVRGGRVRLVAIRPLRAGRYTLTLISADGRHRSVVVTVG